MKNQNAEILGGKAIYDRIEEEIENGTYQPTLEQFAEDLKKDQGSYEQRRAYTYLNELFCRFSNDGDWTLERMLFLFPLLDESSRETEAAKAREIEEAERVKEEAALQAMQTARDEAIENGSAILLQNPEGLQGIFFDCPSLEHLGMVGRRFVLVKAGMVVLENSIVAFSYEKKFYLSRITKDAEGQYFVTLKKWGDVPFENVGLLGAATGQFLVSDYKNDWTSEETAQAFKPFPKDNVHQLSKAKKTKSENTKSTKVPVAA